MLELNEGSRADGSSTAQGSTSLPASDRPGIINGQLRDRFVEAPAHRDLCARGAEPAPAAVVSGRPKSIAERSKSRPAPPKAAHRACAACAARSHLTPLAGHTASSSR
jgi:hypothetical protein